jgi:multisubunit Na+/H+ antiporter MnhB subunit
MLIIVADVVLAVEFNQTISPTDKATFDQILTPVMTIYNLVKYIATAIAGVVLLFAGITYMTSGSDPKKRENAKNMAMYVVIGLIVIWAAPMIVQLLVG